VPERAVDQAMADGHISPSLPFAKKQAMEALKRTYPDRDTAAREIAGAFTEFYGKSYAPLYASNKGAVEQAITAVQGIYGRNIFPDMKITWGTYPSNLGHTDSTGCFRCHDGNHASADGKTIPNDCSTCHDMPAMQERDPKILADLGLKPTAPASK
jgi:hypothetical protein